MNPRRNYREDPLAGEGLGSTAEDTPPPQDDVLNDPGPVSVEELTDREASGTEANQFEPSVDAEAIGGRGSEESYPEAGDLEPNEGSRGTPHFDEHTTDSDEDQARRR